MTDEAQTPEESAGIERSIKAYMTDKRACAFSISELEEAVGMDRKVLWAAIRRLEHKRCIFRFDVDSDTYLVPWEYRKQAYVRTIDPIFDDDQVATLYSAFGTMVPSTLIRTPKMTHNDDDPSLSYNRYLDDEDDGNRENTTVGFHP
jgi:DNA-binding Lrp family transcriptional regulator